LRHIRLTIEYDGTGLAGWQRQPNAPTVQSRLEDALARVLDGPTAVIGASRTDAGVHARAQVASFRTARDTPLYGIRRGLNTILPAQIAVTDAREVSGDFHPRYWATGKHYRYQILARPDRSPRLVTRAWHVSAPLDEAAMRAAAAQVPGERDFSAFRASGCSARTTRRRIDEVTLCRPDPAEPGLLAIDVRGTAFLRHMVRILVGTLVEVGTGRIAPAQMTEILDSCDRNRAGRTAPGHGLELVSVVYDAPAPGGGGV
jgi:tRNA pseudouridine38-40 synthase